MRRSILADIWPSADEIRSVIGTAIDPDLFERTYAVVFEGDERWRALPIPAGDRYAWDPTRPTSPSRRSSRACRSTAGEVRDIVGARVLAVLGDSVTTDHISPAGSIAPWSPAGQWLQEHGVGPLEFNSYGARRGHHEVMMRGTFGNIRLRNRLVEGKEGPYTVHLPSGEETFIYDAAMRYKAEGVPLVLLAGREYGSGSSRDWAAKGTLLLGVKAVIAESYERIHRSNLVGMGVLPLQFKPGDSAASLGLTGRETLSIIGLDAGLTPRQSVTVVAPRARMGGASAIRGDRPPRRPDRGRLLPRWRDPAGGASAPRRRPGLNPAPTHAGTKKPSGEDRGLRSRRSDRVCRDWDATPGPFVTSSRAQDARAASACRSST